MDNNRFAVIKYRRTKKGLVTCLFRNQKTNSKRRGHKSPTYTKQELKEWLFSQHIFHVLFDNWKRLDYQKDYVPSVDRISNNNGYTLDNIQLMTWRENYLKECDYRKNYNIVNGEKAIQRFSLYGGFIDEFSSVIKAEKELNIFSSSIVKVCKGKQKSAGGYLWKYKKEN